MSQVLSFSDFSGQGFMTGTALLYNILYTPVTCCVFLLLNVEWMKPARDLVGVYPCIFIHLSSVLDQHIPLTNFFASCKIITVLLNA